MFSWWLCGTYSVTFLQDLKKRYHLKFSAGFGLPRPSPPPRVSSLLRTSMTTYSLRWTVVALAALGHELVHHCYSQPSPSGSRTSVQVELKPPSSPSSARPSKLSTHNSTRPLIGIGAATKVAKI